MTDGNLLKTNPEASPTTSLGRRLSSKILILLALPSGFADIGLLPFAFIIPLFYAKTTGLSFAVIGSILMFTKLIDAFTDPTVGILSDRIETKYGRRKPWVAVGSVILAIGFFFIFTPSTHNGAIYFTTWVVLMYLGYTIFSVPKLAWHSEISRNYDERQRVVAYVAVVHFISTLLIVSSPILLSPITGTTEFTPEILKVMAIIVLISLPISSILAVRYVPKEERLTTKSGRLRDLPDMFLRNRPFVVFIIAFVLWNIGMGSWVGTSFIFVDSYMQKGYLFSWMLVAGYVVRLVLTPLWVRIINRTEKHKAFCFAGLGCTFFLPFTLLLHPGIQSPIPLLLLAVAVSVFDAALYILPASIIGDTADYDSYLTGLDRTATYKTALSLILKGATALGTGLGLILIDFFVFILEGPNDAGAIMGLKFVFAILPSILFVISVAIMFNFELTRKRHRTVIRVLQRRMKVDNS